jgi:hypothetical protein
MHKTELLRAIELASNGEWDEPHRIVQQYNDTFACWIHAVLHKIEGDEENSRYWYARAGKPFNSSSNHKDELQQIRTSLMNSSAS